MEKDCTNCFYGYRNACGDWVCMHGWGSSGAILEEPLTDCGDWEAELGKEDDNNA